MTKWNDRNWIKPARDCLLIAGFVLVAGQSIAQKAGALHRPIERKPELVRELGGIEEYLLPNGLQVLLFHEPAQPTVTVNITYRVGSRHESPGEYGMAHLLEHLLFKGTERHRDIPASMAQRGVRFNGTTTGDRTNYFASFNSNADTLQFLIELEADRMVNSRVAKEDLDREMTVVRNEFERGENQPFSVLTQRINSVAYNWHPYGNATIGAKSDIEGVSIERLRAFYRRYYRPDNAVLMVAGGFDKKATLASISSAFANVEAPSTPIPRLYTVEPPQDGEKTVTVRRVGGQPMVMASYHVPAVAHPDAAPLIVYSLLMSMQPSGQLYQRLVESKLAVAAGLGFGSGADPGTMTAFAVLSNEGDMEKVESMLLEMAEGRQVKALDASELERVREVVVVGYRQQMKSPEALINQLSNLVAAGDWRLLFQIMEDLPRVTLADVERVRGAYFKPTNRTIGRYLPTQAVDRVVVPPAPPMDQRLAELKGPPMVEAAEELDPVPAVLEQRTTRKQAPSGIQIHALHKQTRGNSVDVLIEMRWADRDTTFPIRGTDIVGALLTEGTTKVSKQALQDTLVKLKAALSASSDDQSATLRVSAERDTLIPALTLVADLLQNPLLPEAAFERHKKAAISQLQASRFEPETARADATRAHYNLARGVSYGHPDFIQSLDDRIHSVQTTTWEGVKQFHADYWSANQMRVFAVGALPDNLHKEVDRLFGSWKKPKAPAFVEHNERHVPIPAARFDAKVKDKPNAIVRFALDLPLTRDASDRMALVVAVHAFGGGSLANRLSERVRQKDGLSYGIGADLSVPLLGDASRLTIQGSFAPANRDRVIDAVNEELVRMTNEGLTAEELSRAKKDLLEGRKLARSNDGALLNALRALADRQSSWAQAQADDDAIAAVTLESAHAAWRRYVNPKGFVISTAGDYQ